MTIKHFPLNFSTYNPGLGSKFLELGRGGGWGGDSSEGYLKWDGRGH